MGTNRSRRHVPSLRLQQTRSGKGKRALAAGESWGEGAESGLDSRVNDYLDFTGAPDVVYTVKPTGDPAFPVPAPAPFRPPRPHSPQRKALQSSRSSGLCAEMTPSQVWLSPIPTPPSRGVTGNSRPLACPLPLPNPTSRPTLTLPRPGC